MGIGSSCNMRPRSPASTSSALTLANAWQYGGVPPEHAANCFGRLIYQRRGDDLATMHLVDQRRRVCFVADGASWVQCLKDKLGAREILQRNGVEPAWIEAELEKRTTFHLVLLDQDESIWPANWDGVQRAVETYHPRAAERMRPHWTALRHASWKELEQQQMMKTPGEDFAALEARHGPMTEELYLNGDRSEGSSDGAGTDDTPARARRFLASTLSLNRLFTGTGYTVDERVALRRGTAEYFAPNRRLSSLPPTQVVEIDADTAHKSCISAVVQH